MSGDGSRPPAPSHKLRPPGQVGPRWLWTELPVFAERTINTQSQQLPVTWSHTGDSRAQRTGPSLPFRRPGPREWEGQGQHALPGSSAPSCPWAASWRCQGRVLLGEAAGPRVRGAGAEGGQCPKHSAGVGAPWGLRTPWRSPPGPQLPVTVTRPPLPSLGPLAGPVHHLKGPSPQPASGCPGCGMPTPGSHRPQLQAPVAKDLK